MSPFWPPLLSPALATLATAVALAALAAPVHAQGLGRGTPDAPVTAWPTAPPDSLGLDADALAAHAAQCEATGATACLVAYRGFVVQEWEAPDYAYGPWIRLRSATKSITGLLVGMLLGDGALADLDQPVADVIPEWQAGADSAVTIRHLVTMTAGLRGNP